MSSTGVIQEWRIDCRISANFIPYYVIQYGQLGGTIQTTMTSIRCGKNIGKANETTPWEQCCLEAQSLWTKQRDRKGYSESIPDEKPLRPMLAKSYNKDGHHIEFPCYVQPKLDGIRCLARRTAVGVELLSRQGKKFTSIPHIEKQLMWLPKDVVLDGELYIHGEEFQDIISAVKRDKPSSASGKINYYIYDMINDWDYKKRYHWLSQRLTMPNYLGCKQRKNEVDITHLCRVETILIHNKAEIWKHHKVATSYGYEGVMLRNLKGPYKINGRSQDLQKVKKFLDMEFEIVDAEQNKGKMVNQCTLICKTKAGKRFGVKPKGTDQQREQYWEDWKAGRLIGKMLTVRFFAWTTSNEPVPRFPVGIIVRDFE